MPFASENQRRWMHANEPRIAHAWEHGKHSSKKNHRMPKRSGRKPRS
jgi:hypothetical protein